MIQIKKLKNKATIAFKMQGFSGLAKEVLLYFLKLVNPPISKASPVKIVPYKNRIAMKTTARRVKYNLNLDDLLPGNSGLVLLKRLVKSFPKIKITIFVPISSREAKNTYILDQPQWCKEIAHLPPKNFEIGVHGYYHHLNDWRKTPEFKYLSKKEATTLLLKCEQVFKKAGIKFIRGFRPPRWEMSKGTEQALEELGYLFLADTPRFYQEHQDIKIPRIFVNSDIKENEEHDEIKTYKDLLLEPQKFCIQRGHLVGYCDNNLTKATFDNIVKIIRSFNKVEFKFLSELAREIV